MAKLPYSGKIWWAIYLAIWSLKQKRCSPRTYKPHGSCHLKVERCLAALAGQFFGTIPSHLVPSPLVCIHCTSLGFEVRLPRPAGYPSYIHCTSTSRKVRVYSPENAISGFFLSAGRKVMLLTKAWGTVWGERAVAIYVPRPQGLILVEFKLAILS